MGVARGRLLTILTLTSEHVQQVLWHPDPSGDASNQVSDLIAHYKQAELSLDSAAFDALQGL